MRPSSRPPERRRHLPALVAIVGALVLGAGGGIFAWLWRSPAPLRGEPIVDEKGRDALRVICASCPDDTVLTVDPSSVAVRNHSAELVLPAPLRVGDNRITVRVDRPGRGRDETIELIVPIAYRIRPDLSGLDQEAPSVRLQVEASSKTRVTIAGQPITVGADGKGSFDLDLSRACTGPSDEPAVIDKQIPYAADTQGAVIQDAVALRLAIPALHLDAPNAHVVIETDQVPLSGRTSRGAQISVLGKKVAASQDGSFAGSIQLPLGVSEIVVRASAPDQAPRIVHLSVKRVARLSDEARDFASRATLTPASMAQHPDESAGQLVVFGAEVLESRTQNNASVALVDLGRTCPSPPCLARVLMAPADRVSRGDQLRVYGRVVRAFRTTGQPGAPSSATDAIPEVSADFVLRGR